MKSFIATLVGILAISASLWASPPPSMDPDAFFAPMGTGLMFIDLSLCPSSRGCPYAVASNGTWRNLHVDASGNLLLAAAAAGVPATGNCPSQGSCPYALNPSGAWVNLNVDGSGNLLASVSGGGGSGDFSGPASSTSGNLVSFNGTGGKTGQDSGVAAANVVTAASNYTANKLIKAGGANKTTSASLATDDGTTFTYTGTGGGSFASLATSGTATADSCTELAFSTQANAGFISFWCDTTNHRLNDINSSGTIGTTVVASACALHQFFNSITAAGGVVNCAALVASDLPATLTSGTAITNAALTTPTLTGAVTKTGQNEIVASSGGINTVETILVQSPAALAANRLIAKSRILVTLVGTCTASVANTSTFKIRIGTAGTTSDTAAFSVTTPASAASGTNVPFRVILDMVVRVPGASATSYGEYSLTNQGVTGLSTSQANTNLATMTAFDTTAADFVTVTYVSAASTTTSTFQIASIEFPNN